jgi:hypothetical protein
MTSGALNSTLPYCSSMFLAFEKESSPLCTIQDPMKPRFTSSHPP